MEKEAKEQWKNMVRNIIKSTPEQKQDQKERFPIPKFLKVYIDKN